MEASQRVRGRPPSCRHRAATAERPRAWGDASLSMWSAPRWRGASPSPGTGWRPEQLDRACEGASFARTGANLPLGRPRDRRVLPPAWPPGQPTGRWQHLRAKPGAPSCHCRRRLRHGRLLGGVRILRGWGRFRGCRGGSPSGSVGGGTSAGGRTPAPRPSAGCPGGNRVRFRAGRSGALLRDPGPGAGTCRGCSRGHPALRPGGVVDGLAFRVPAARPGGVGSAG